MEIFAGGREVKRDCIKYSRNNLKNYRNFAAGHLAFSVVYSACAAFGSAALSRTVFAGGRECGSACAGELSVSSDPPACGF